MVWQCISSSPPRLAILACFVFLWTSMLLWNYDRSAHDPSSLLYSGSRGHEKIYSLTREKQANDFIEIANHGQSHGSIRSNANPSLCLAVATVARPGSQYIHTTVGSILEGLSDKERAEIHFMFLIAHSDPTLHPVSNETWTKSVPDTILSYATLPLEKQDEIKRWEHDNDYISKGLSDYHLLVESCYAKTKAPYIAVFEGDVLAVRGWYQRAIAAAKQLDSGEDTTKIYDTVKDEVPSSWLYLRLFYTEYWLAWNSEEWPTFLSHSLLTFGAVSVTLFGLRFCFPRRLKEPLSNVNMVGILFVLVPMTIGLGFVLGRATMAGLPKPYPAGLQPMNNYGCCSQGFIYPRRIIPFIMKRIEERSKPYIDMMMEDVAARYNLQRWTVNPSLLQHIGTKSAKADAIADGRAKMIWSYGFERWASSGAIGMGL